MSISGAIWQSYHIIPPDGSSLTTVLRIRSDDFCLSWPRSKKRGWCCALTEPAEYFQRRWPEALELRPPYKARGKVRPERHQDVHHQRPSRRHLLPAGPHRPIRRTQARGAWSAFIAREGRRRAYLRVRGRDMDKMGYRGLDSLRIAYLRISRIPTDNLVGGEFKAGDSGRMMSGLRDRAHQHRRPDFRGGCPGRRHSSMRRYWYLPSSATPLVCRFQQLTRRFN